MSARWDQIRPLLYMLLMLAVALACMASFCGCDSLRWAPSEAEKQNAALHVQTSQALAARIEPNKTADTLDDALADLNAKQAGAITAHYGPPKEPVPQVPWEDLPATAPVTDEAGQDAAQRPDVFDLTDFAIDNVEAIAIALGLGGAAAGAIARAKATSKALRETVGGIQKYRDQANTAEKTKLGEILAKAQSGKTKTEVAKAKVANGTS